MVDHNQKGVKAIGDGEVSDQIIGDLLEGVSGSGDNGGQWGV